MKKIPFLALILFCVSCSKDINLISGTQMSTNLNFKVGSTGVSLSQAQDLAIKFLQTKSPNINIRIKEAYTLVYNGKPYFHIVNTNAGFVMLSSDSNYAPLLAYDSVQNFSLKEEDLSPGLKMWLNKNANQLDQVRNEKSPYIDSAIIINKNYWNVLSNGPTNNSKDTYIRTNGEHDLVTAPVLISSVPATKTTTSIVGALCPTAWDQNYPFNEDCPVSTASSDVGSQYEGHYPAGCVPIAMAQIMYFWKVPAAYSWTGMATAVGNPGSFTSSAQLISDIGSTTGSIFLTASSGFSTSHFANYQPASAGGTGCDDTFCPYVFGVFGFSSASRSENILNQSLTGVKSGYVYTQNLSNELQNYARPCLVGGYSGTGTNGINPYPNGDGHEWVCDGSNETTVLTGVTNTYKDFYGNITTQTTYTTTVVWYYLHLNWGHGVNNVWYAGSNYTQESSTSENFQYFQTIITNIHP